MKNKIFLVLLIAFLSLSLSGCITIKKPASAPVTNLGGFFVSGDKMETWKNRSTLMTPGAVAGTMNNTDVYALRLDPSDDQAIYALTRANGLYYTYNGAEGWNHADKLPEGFIRDLVIDNSDKCTLYAGVLGRIYKSEDCSRSWKSVWYSDNAERQVASLAIDSFNPSVIYAGTTEGSILKTENGGASWTLLTKYKNRVQRLIVDPNNNNIVYAGIWNT